LSRTGAPAVICVVPKPDHCVAIDGADIATKNFAAIRSDNTRAHRLPRQGGISLGNFIKLELAVDRWHGRRIGYKATACGGSAG
jgi:hypothetical protein